MQVYRRLLIIWISWFCLALLISACGENTPTILPSPTTLVATTTTAAPTTSAANPTSGVTTTAEASAVTTKADPTSPPSNAPFGQWTNSELAREVVRRGIVPKISPRSIARFLK